MEKKLKVLVFVDQKEACLAGKTVYGDIVVDVTDELMAKLTSAEREALLWDVRLRDGEDVCRLGTYNHFHEPELTHYDAQFAEASEDAIVACLQARAAAKAVWQVKHDDIEAKDKIENEAKIAEFLATPVEQFVFVKESQYSSLPCYRTDWPYINESEEVKAKREQIKQLAAAKTAELHQLMAEAFCNSNEHAVYTESEKAGKRWSIVKTITLCGYKIDYDSARCINDATKAKGDEQRAIAEKCNQNDKNVFKGKVIVLLDQHGTESQRERFATGYLPQDELLDVVRGMLFTPLDNFPRYQRLKKSDVTCDCEYRDVSFDTDDVEQLDKDEFENLKHIQKAAEAIPVSYKVVPQVHKAYCDNKECDACVTRTSALVTVEWEGYKLSREYAL